MTETKQINAVSAALVKTTAKWESWTVVDEVGDTWSIGKPIDANFNMNAKQVITVYQGPYGLLLHKSNYEGGGSSSGSRGGYQKGSPSKASGGGNSREAYWEDKAKYEVETRDPKIEWQTYFTNICNIYAAGIPSMTQEDWTIRRLDELINDAAAQADAIFRRQNPKQ